MKLLAVFPLILAAFHSLFIATPLAIASTVRRVWGLVFSGLVAWVVCWSYRRNWVKRVTMPWPVPAPASPKWEKEDAERLLYFLNSPVGQKLMERMRRAEYDMATHACGNAQANHAYATGYASGFRSCAALLVVLSVAPTESEQADEDQLGEDSVRARNAP